ncbi:hypothetical protein JOC54_001871 [Alkalihalobacillus xiaoxiensis]|uniref:Uncharacterized protein n=1 Tax=Shouchella xiaoxiensis TaxID=766895 RepID=A0ABS2SSW3_9BACI|nr:hypothetical protein [Shouchella xiaoxiensis]MBM7838615.1 hypothetical protein [Shouchella xiaoxiensis]
MLVLTEGWFQFSLIILMIILLAVSLLMVHAFLRKKERYSKKKEQTSSFLTFLSVLTIYFALSISMPEAFYADVLITSDDEQLVEDEHVRYFSFSSIYRVHAIETGAFTREAQGTTVLINTEFYQPLFELVDDDESLLRSDGTVDMSQYLDKTIVPALQQLDDEEITLTQLYERYPHHQFSFQEE